MKQLEIFFYYITWHYSNAVLEYVRVWKNLLWFSVSYFSVGVLLKTLFKPFFHLGENASTEDLGHELKVVSIFSGLFGFIIRLVSIIAGIFLWILTLMSGLMLSIVWLCLPFIIVFLFVTGLMAIFGTPA